MPALSTPALGTREVNLVARMANMIPMNWSIMAACRIKASRPCIPGSKQEFYRQAPNTTQALSHITAKMSETILTHP